MIILFSTCAYWHNQYLFAIQELHSSQNNLKIETEKSLLLGEELCEASATIADLKNEEYEFMYLGEFRLTAYCACQQCCGYWATIRETDEHGNQIVYTASGAVAKAGVTIAVDKSVIPYGTNVYIAGHGLYVAQDCGGAIKGNSIDVFFDSHEEAIKFGVCSQDVWVLIKNP